MTKEMMQDLRGEGFAFFRWHMLRYGRMECNGWLQFPKAVCIREWGELNP